MRLRQIMKEKHINGTQLAEMLGVSTSYINSAAAGRINMSIKRCEEIAKVLDVPLAAIFDGYNEPSVTLCPHCGKPIKIVIG